MKFRNKPLTNIVVTTVVAALSATLAAYMLPFLALVLFDLRIDDGIVFIPFFIVAWPSVFLYRSLILPKSISFLEKGVTVQIPFLGVREYDYDDMVGVDSSVISNNEEKYVFTMRNGKRYKFALESYEVRRLRGFIEKYDLPRK